MPVSQFRTHVLFNLANVFKHSDSVATIACFAWLVNPKLALFVLLFKQQVSFVNHESLVKFD